MKRKSGGKGSKLIIFLIGILLVIFAIIYIYASLDKKDYNDNKDDNIVETPIEEPKKEENKEEKKEEDKKEEPLKEKEEDKKTPEVYNAKYLNKVYNNSGITIKDGWQEMITKYLDSYYKSLINLKVEDITNLFTNSDSNEAYLTQKTLEFLVTHHKMQKSNMSLSSAKYDINYKSVSISGNIVTVKFLKNEYLKFSYLNGIESKSYDMDNTIVIRKTDDTYTIDSIRVVQDYYVIFTHEINISSENAKSNIDSHFDKYISNSKSEVDKNQELQNNASSYKESKSYSNPYNRETAEEYANKYVSKRNPDFTAYDSSGGNCMNFASQVINAGGIPMDYEGSYQWKHYSQTLDSSNTANGRSASWVSTNSFYDYAKNNDGYGLVSEVDINIFAGEVGDIIQVGYDGYSHTAVVVGIVKDSKDKTIDLLINCNTLSLEKYPLLAYTYQNKRLIKILGYND